jgi:hypothetical protein
MLHRRFVPIVALAAALSACGADTAPTEPTPPATSTLSVFSFTVGGWHADGRFHYVPRLAVTARPGAVDVHEVRFERSDGGIDATVTGAQFGTPRHVLPGGFVPITGDYEFVTSSPLETLKVRVFYVDQSSRSETAVADTAVPEFPRDTPEAALAIRAFSVFGSSVDGGFRYWPQLTLAETTGRSSVSIVSITYQLLDVFPADPVRPYGGPLQVQVRAGQAIVLDVGGYGEPWGEFASQADASRVSVVIWFVDSAGRGGAVRAVADVSR